MMEGKWQMGRHAGGEGTAGGVGRVSGAGRKKNKNGRNGV